METVNLPQTDAAPHVPKLSPAQIIGFTSAAAVTAAATGIAGYLYLKRREMSTPQHILSRCRFAIEQLEKSIESTHA